MDIRLIVHKEPDYTLGPPEYKIVVEVNTNGMTVRRPKHDYNDFFVKDLISSEMSAVTSTNFKYEDVVIPSVRLIVKWDFTKQLGDAFDKFLYQCKTQLIKLYQDKDIADIVLEHIRKRAVDEASQVPTPYSATILLKNKYLYAPNSGHGFSELVSIHEQLMGSGFNNDSDFSSLSRNLPGMNEMVDCPACGYDKHLDATVGPQQRSTVWRTVQHLNDRHRWTRESIADWLDELHDNGVVDIEFDVPLEGGEE